MQLGKSVIIIGLALLIPLIIVNLLSTVAHIFFTLGCYRLLLPFPVISFTTCVLPGCQESSYFSIVGLVLSGLLMLSVLYLYNKCNLKWYWGSVLTFSVGVVIVTYLTIGLALWREFVERPTPEVSIENGVYNPLHGGDYCTPWK